MRTYRLLLIFGVIICGSLGLTIPGLSQETADLDNLDGLLDGFDATETSVKNTAQPLTQTDPDVFKLGGSVSLSSTFNIHSHRTTDDGVNLAGLSRLRGELDLIGDLYLPGTWRARISGESFYDFAYALRGRSNYSEQVLDEYEKEVRLGETWLRGQLFPNMDLQIGRQIVVWGKSDNIRITDVINPLDMREPGMTDIEDLRLPSFMTRLDYAMGNWNITGLAIHEIRFNEEPVYGSDYYFYKSDLPPEITPDQNFSNQEFGLAAEASFSGLDVSFIAAYLFDDQAHLELTENGLRRVHSRITMFGGSGNLAYGNWLFKSEVALFQGLEYSNVPDDDFSRLDMLLGCEYSGISETTISIEVANRHIIQYDQQLKDDPAYIVKNDFQWALRISRDFMHERLNTTLLAGIYGPLGQDGSYQRLQIEYDLDDSWELSAGVVFYQGGGNPAFEKYKDNDRIFMTLEYAF